MFPAGFIAKERIGCQLEISSKKRVLEELGSLLASASPGLTQDLVFDALLDRERLGSTGLGRGVALPHARMPQVKKAVGAFVQLSSGVAFDAIDDQPVDIAFAMLVPQSATDEHLQLLAGLATMFSDQELCADLRSATDSDSILQRIVEWETSREPA